MPWEITANRLAEEAKVRRAAAERAAAEQRAREERAAAAATKAAAERAQRHAELEAEKQARLEAQREEASSRARLKAEKEKVAAARTAERAAAEMAAQEKAAADRAAARKVREANKESNKEARAAAKAARAAERVEVEAKGAHDGANRVEVEAEGAHDGAHDAQLTGTHSRPSKRSRSVSKVLPPGWREQLHHANSRTYSTFHGPNGEKARSIAEAIRIHDAAGGGGGRGGGRGGSSLDGDASPTSGVAAMDREVQAAAASWSSSSAVEHAADEDSSDNCEIPLNAKARKLSKPFSPRKPELTSASDGVPPSDSSDSFHSFHRASTALTASTDGVPPSDSSDDELREKDTLLQKRITVWWTGTKQWFAGHVVDVRWDKGEPAHRIQYEADGVSQWHKLLGKEPVKWKELPDERSPGRSASGVQALD